MLYSAISNILKLIQQSCENIFKVGQKYGFSINWDQKITAKYVLGIFVSNSSSNKSNSILRQVQISQILHQI